MAADNNISRNKFKDTLYNADGQLVSRSNSDVTINNGGQIASKTQITYCRTYNQQGQPIASWDVGQAEANCSQPGVTAQDYKVWTYYQPGNRQDQPVGKLKRIAFADPHNADAITYSYYLDGKLKQASYAGGLAINYYYNAAGQPTQVSYRQGSTLQNQSDYLYGIGTAHQLLQVKNGAAQVSYQYNDQGNPRVINRTNGAHLWITTWKLYNGYHLLDTQVTCLGHRCQVDSPQVQQQIKYSYTQGQLTGVRVKHPQLNLKATDNHYNQFNYIKHYSYDGLDRLKQVSTLTLAGSEIKTIDYQFDLNNNITGITTTEYGPAAIISQQQVKRDYNNADQLISQTTDNESTHYLSYTAGNVTQGADGSQYKYNHLNQLVSYNPPAGNGGTEKNSTHYQYYPDGQLQSESQGEHKLTFYYSHGQVARVVDNQGSWTSYLGGLTRKLVVYHHAGGKNQAAFYAYQGKTPSGWLGQGKTTWQQHNAYGLIEAVYHPVNTTNPLSLADNPELMGFNGNYQDPVSHTVFMGARNYSPESGRFLQEDSYVNVPNLYAYAQGNPIEKYDPSGHMAKWLKWLLGVGLAAVGVVAGLVSGGVGFAALAAEVTVSGVIGATSSVAGAVGASLSLAGNALQLTNHSPGLADKLDLAGGVLMAAALVGVAMEGIAEVTASKLFDASDDDILNPKTYKEAREEFEVKRLQDYLKDNSELRMGDESEEFDSGAEMDGVSKDADFNEIPLDQRIVTDSFSDSRILPEGTNTTVQSDFNPWQEAIKVEDQEKAAEPSLLGSFETI